MGKLGEVISPVIYQRHLLMMLHLSEVKHKFGLELIILYM